MIYILLTGTFDLLVGLLVYLDSVIIKYPYTGGTIKIHQSIRSSIHPIHSLSHTATGVDTFRLHGTTFTLHYIYPHIPPFITSIRPFITQEDDQLHIHHIHHINRFKII